MMKITQIDYELYTQMFNEHVERMGPAMNSGSHDEEWEEFTYELAKKYKCDQLEFEDTLNVYPYDHR